MTNTEQGYMGKYLKFYEQEFRPLHVLQRLANPSAVITTKKRFPDVSFYQGNINFDIMRGSTDAVIIRAGQRTWIDTKFIRNYAEAKRVGMKRGVYWFFDDRDSPATQAALLIGLLKNELPEMEIIADWENTYGGVYNKLSHVTEFMKLIEAAFPTARVGIYTGYYWMKDHTILSEHEYLKTKPLWLAWYTNNPANVLIPAPWTKLTHWQFGTPAEGAVYGTQTNNIDMNYFNGTLVEFDARYTPTIPIPTTRPLDTESHTTPFEGIEHHRVYNYGSWCSIVIIDPQKMGFTVTPFNMRTTSQAARDLGAQITINGGAHTALRAIGLHVSEGKYLATQSEYEPFINFTASQVPQVEYYDSHVPLYNALAGKRMIVEYGQVSVNNSAAWYEVHPRTLAGMDALGRVVFCTIDGRQDPYSIGLNLFQSAKIMVAYGCVRAIDLDGGGSTTLVIQQPDLSQKVMNYPIDTGVVGKERIVGNHIAVFTGDVVTPPQTGENMYSMTPINNDTRIRANHSTFDAVLQSVAADVVVSGDILWVAPADGTEVKAGDQWLLVTKVNGSPISQIGWMARIHKGVTICDNFITVPTDPPQTTVTYTATIKDDVTGETWSGTLTKQA